MALPLRQSFVTFRYEFSVWVYCHVLVNQSVVPVAVWPDELPVTQGHYVQNVIVVYNIVLACHCLVMSSPYYARMQYFQWIVPVALNLWYFKWIIAPVLMCRYLWKRPIIPLEIIWCNLILVSCWTFSLKFEMKKTVSIVYWQYQLLWKNKCIHSLYNNVADNCTDQIFQDINLSHLMLLLASLISYM